MRLLLTILTAAIFPVQAAAGLLLPDSTVTLLDSACTRSGISIAELGFEKKWVEDDTFRLTLIEELLDEPLKMAATGDLFQTILTDTLSPLQQLQLFSRHLKQPLTPAVTSTGNSISTDTANQKNHLNREIIPESLLPFLDRIAVADSLLRLFYSQLSFDDRLNILYRAISSWSEEEEADYDGLLLPACMEPDSLEDYGGFDLMYSIAARVDLTPLFHSLQQTVAALESLSRDPAVYASLNPPRGYSTPWGTILIGSSEDDQHAVSDFLLLIDPGGDDRYSNGVPRAVGGVHEPALQLILDLAGDDLYHASGNAVSQGSAVLGIAVLGDENGRDTYLGEMHTQGSALFGGALLLDNAGDDTYRGDFFAQGAGHFGIGLLCDEAGDDLYQSAAWCQGMGGTFGAGALIDRAGDDRYSAGGRYLHKPLRPQDYRSFAQGFAMGYRDRAGGGIGLLLDGEGNDFYDAEIYAQGCSYWYALGVLIDRQGNDHYQATQYAQGAGIHLSCGLLADNSGDDHYYSRFGPSQGTGHDYSVGMLLDGQGNDNYQVSGGIGVSLTNSVGLLLDSGGDDMYSFSEVWGLGSVRHGRGYAGSALFLDLGGDDTYPAASPAANDSLWLQHDYGLGWDRAAPGDDSPAAGQPAADSLSGAEDMPLDSLWNIAVEWGVGENRIRVPQARRALAERIEEVVPFLREERKLDSSSGLVMRALDVIVKKESEAMTPLLLECLADSSHDTRVMALGLMADTLFQAQATVVAASVDTLQGRELRTSLLTLGAMRSEEHLPLLAGYLDSDEERLRLTSVRALAATRAESALPWLMQGLQDPLFTVRSAVVDRMGRFSLKGVLQQLPADTPDHEQRLVLEKCLQRSEEEGGWLMRWRVKRRLGRLSSGI